MHYIRLLRPPKVVRHTGLHLELVFTITTDLGDSFLYPDEAIDLQITANIYETKEVVRLRLTKKGQLEWQSGMRVAKPKIPIPRPLQVALASGTKVEIGICTSSKISANGVQNILLNSEPAEGMGQIMPAWVALSESQEGVDVSTRKILLDDGAEEKYVVQVEEEIGESIARHIWDAGVLAMCSIAGTYLCSRLECSQHSLPAAMKTIFASKRSLNVLELGCGVGILGIGLATIFPELRKAELEQCTIMMTDLDEAEGRARSNMQRIPTTAEYDGLSVLYENLDWEDGRKGKLGPKIGSRSWDLIIISDCTYNVDMLPALVETLGAIHNSTGSKGVQTDNKTTVFLATKPRHASEKVFFELMNANEWTIQESQVLPLPVLGNEDESVELYLFDRH